MNKKEKEIALFRLMVLGALASRDQLHRGEVKKTLHDLARKTYQIPYSTHCRLSAKTIERWYYAWLKGGFDALAPAKRSDQGRSHIPPLVQEKILTLKKENSSRSLNTILHLLKTQGIASKNVVSRASLHRFLQRHQQSKRTTCALTIERRSFEAAHAGDIWQGDVLHGPTIYTPEGKRKVYLVSLMDDASRLIVHSAFCFGETALDVEGVLKQSLLKRGMPRKIILDNGAAYRSNSLQFICAKLEIRLIYCPPYEPQGKGKLERWHRTFREQFLNELAIDQIKNLDDLNMRLWAWIEEVYHQRPHSSLPQRTSPLQQWRNDLVHVRPLGCYAHDIDDYFYHRIKRKVKKDGSVSWEGNSFEVAYELSGNSVHLVVDPHEKIAIKVESLSGDNLGAAYPLDKHKNCHRQRQRPETPKNKGMPSEMKNKDNVVDLAVQSYEKKHIIASDK
jgi:putative transposase